MRHPAITRAALRWSAAAVCAAIALAPAALAAGPIDPPPGPVAPTYKTLQQVEPRTPIAQADIPLAITASGSYYLTENITAPGIGVNDAIRILADDVTLDLAGFVIYAGEVTVPRHGVFIGERVDNTTILNGTIRNCAQTAVAGASAPSCRVEGVRAVGNGVSGIIVGDGSLVRGCLAAENTLSGIVVGIGGQVVQCVARNNGVPAQVIGPGIVGGIGSNIAHCTARGNGSHGISVGTNSTVTGCTSSGNTAHGVNAGSSTTIAGCTSSGNGQNGVQLADDCTVTDTTCRANTRGVSSSSIGGYTVARCTIAQNSQVGIQVLSNCTIIDNTVIGGERGINAVGSDSRIDGNNVLDQTAFGIILVSGGNILVRNTASGSPVRYSTAAGNAVGQINNVAGGAVITIDNPWANFQY